MVVIEWIKLKKSDGSYLFVQSSKISALVEHVVPSGYGHEKKTTVMLLLDNNLHYELAGSLNDNMKFISGE